MFGCVDSIGRQAGDIARTCWLAAGLPEEVPGTTVDRQCGSSQQAVHFAAQAVMSGTMDVVVAGGVQNMSQIPISSAMLVGQQFGFDDPFSGSEGWVARYGTQEVSQFRAAEMIAEKWDISREDMEAFAVESHERALRAQRRGPVRRRDRAARRLSRPTRARASRTGTRSGRCPRWPRAGGSPPRAPRRSPTPRPRCSSSRAGPGRPRPHAAGAHPPPLRAWRRPGVDAHRADPGDRVRAREDGHVARRHRPGRDQRGVRVGRARLGPRDRRRPRARSTSTAAPSPSATRSAPPAPG